MKSQKKESAGCYLVLFYAPSLLIGGPGGNSRQTLAEAITVYEPATADFSASPTSGPPPLTVNFKNLSTFMPTVLGK